MAETVTHTVLHLTEISRGSTLHAESVATALSAALDYMFMYKLPAGDGDYREAYLFLDLADAYHLYDHGIERQGRSAGAEEFMRWLDVSAALSPVSPEPLPFTGGVAFVCAFDFHSLCRDENDRVDLAAVLKERLRASDGERGRLLGVFAAPEEFYLLLVGEAPVDNRLVRCRVGSQWALRSCPVFPPAESVSRDECSVLVLEIGQVRNYLDEHGYLSRFSRLRPYFERGEIYQVILSTEMAIESGAPLELFLRLRSLYDTAPFHYFAELPEDTLLGCCALPYIEVKNGRVSSTVFAGTLGAPHTGENHETQRGRFLRSERFLAEHLMLVDLERNDIGRLCRGGSVTVDNLLGITTVGSTAYLSSTVSGSLREEAAVSEVLFSSVPRGVVSGAPKRRSLDVIREIEGRDRGWYAGCIGVVRGGGDILSNCIVTCAAVKNGEARIPVGSGVLLRSNAEDELEELCHKARYLLSACVGHGNG